MGRRFAWIVRGAFTAICIACAPAATPQPNDIPIPTVDVDSTIEAAVQRTLSAITPTPDWILEKIKRDRLAEQLLIEAYVLAQAQKGGSIYRNTLAGVIESFVPIYMAIACVEGSQPSVEGFRTYIGDGESDRTREQSARRAIQAIDATHDKWLDQRLDPATQHCLQSYLYPESLSDASSPVGLFNLANFADLSSAFRGGRESANKRRAAQ